MSSYSEAEVIRKAKALKIWAEIGYTPDLARYDMGGRVPEEVYVDRIIRHMVEEVLIMIQGRGLVGADLHEQALCEYFGMDVGLVRQVTTARRRLFGKKGSPQERDFHDTIRGLKGADK